MKVERQESRVEGRKRKIALRSMSGSRLWTLDSRLPRGVTLIELLITIMIISILAAAVLGVAAVAGETAREAKTRSIISRIHTLLMEQYDTYTNRRVKLRQKVIEAINNLPSSYRASDRGQTQGRMPALCTARNDADGSARPLERRAA